MIRPFVFLAVSLAATPQPISDACICQDAVVNHRWCDVCGVGYVAGVRIKSKLLFEALDAHGHEIDTKTIVCPTCRIALETDGFCEPCRVGFIRRQMYFTRIAYLLGKGEGVRLDALAFPVCSENAKTTGWCEKCNRGMVGHTAFSDKNLFQAAQEAYRFLLEAVKLLETCDICAVAMFFDNTCPIHKATYRNGKRVETGPADSE